VSGEVVAVNTDLKQHPEVVNKDPHATWMIKVRPSQEAGAGTLLDSAQYQAILK
jgi:glycine cleavage system H protein